ncbi:MAG: gamma-glutamylcyclotransferase [Casimicrobiaceae bacterium]|nr:gamma-glutamylcyclotransferase [Casimicrobiaceae bacterium]MDW8313216.1 gamma-glutamylcyclotransferase [Burkholderiales bacterium]
MNQASEGRVTRGITREDIEADAAREAFARSPLVAGRLLSEQALERSLEATLAHWNGRDDVFVFGYGSLIWNPCLEYVARYPARVRGWHRRFCLWSSVYRGTPERPGLVLALDRGGAVRGLVYRIHAKVARRELRLLWRREMTAGSYQARWLRCELCEAVACEDVRGVVSAIGFVIDRTAPTYAGHLSDEAIVERLVTTAGRYGSGAEYLYQTDAALRASGIVDPYLDRLCRLMAERHFKAAGARPSCFGRPRVQTS